eukprot:SAG11_NODE_1904_length_4088_cov_3.427676_2_plen_53_part_00
MMVALLACFDQVRFPAIRERLEAQGFAVQFNPSFWRVVQVRAHQAVTAPRHE